MAARTTAIARAAAAVLIVGAVATFVVGLTMIPGSPLPGALVAASGLVVAGAAAHVLTFVLLRRRDDDRGAE